MQLKQLINDAGEYAVKNNICNTTMCGTSLYDVNFKQDNLYPLIYISPSQNNNITNSVITYNITLYYIDRLLRDNDNDIDIISTSINHLQKLINIIKKFDYVLKIDNNYQITNFADSSHLADNVAGAYVSLNVSVKNNIGNCDIDIELPNINVSTIIYQIKDINITENGDYNVTYDSEYNALKEVNVNVNIDTQSYYNNGYNTGKIEGYNEGFEQGNINGREEQKSLLENIVITENGVYDNENGYDEVTVEIDTQSYYDNGYNNGYVQGETEGYNEGFAEGFDDGKEEQKSLIQPIIITENGEYVNENGYSPITVNVSDNQKPKVPNGITLQGSTFSTIDMSKWDWGNVYDWGDMFSACVNLTEIQNFPTDVEILATARMFSDCNKLTSIPQFDTSNVINMQNMFYDCRLLTSLDLSLFDTSNVTDMQYMFFGCTSLTSLDLSSFDTSNVINMRYMFYNCNKITSLDMSSFDTSKVTNMSYMFNRCSKLTSLDLSSFDTSKVTNMGDMFNSCSNLTTISNLDITNATSMSYMFSNCYKLQSITFKGKTTSSLIMYSSTFTNAGKDVTNPILYYPQEFANDYQKIINVLPSKWTAVPY